MGHTPKSQAMKDAEQLLVEYIDSELNRLNNDEELKKRYSFQIQEYKSIKDSVNSLTNTLDEKTYFQKLSELVNKTADNAAQTDAKPESSSLWNQLMELIQAIKNWFLGQPAEEKAEVKTPPNLQKFKDTCQDIKKQFEGLDDQFNKEDINVLKSTLDNPEEPSEPKYR